MLTTGFLTSKPMWWKQQQVSQERNFCVYFWFNSHKISNDLCKIYILFLLISFIFISTKFALLSSVCLYLPELCFPNHKIRYCKTTLNKLDFCLQFGSQIKCLISLYVCYVAKKQVNLLQDLQLISAFMPCFDSLCPFQDTNPHFQIKFLEHIKLHREQVQLSQHSGKHCFPKKIWPWGLNYLLKSWFCNNLYYKGI